jgi:hypothetical protein
VSETVDAQFNRRGGCAEQSTLSIRDSRFYLTNVAVTLAESARRTLDERSTNGLWGLLGVGVGVGVGVGAGAGAGAT